MKLVIVESPTKAKTISKFLGAGYKVDSSFGHVRDLPTSTIGIDVKKDFEPKYVIPTKARKTVSRLKEEAKKAEEIILASDEDREGEAIAWHLAEILGVKPDKAKRIVFHEITKDAILEALETPRGLDEKLFNAQQARRVLDRLVGYELSPLLWKKVARGLSAGRVQSVALRLIVEREKEINAFKADEYWKITAELKTPDQEKISAELYEAAGKTIGKLDIKTEDEAKKLCAGLKSQAYKVDSVELRQAAKKAPTPFRTSVLQQAANRRLGYSAKQTMALAQKLYEKGYISYMRTDSLNLSDKFLKEAHAYLKSELGEKYVLPEHKIFKTKQKGAQEAHEAIRPTNAAAAPSGLKGELEARELKLYDLIWSRTLASQMPDALLDNTKIDISAGDYRLKAEGQTLIFDGYLKIYNEPVGENELPKVKEGEKLDLENIIPEQHFTKPPARYSDATLVKELEKNGVGRPSTYAPTIATLEARNYTERAEDKRLKPTEIAIIVSDLLTEHFPDIVDLDFTAKMEKKFDRIADGRLEWRPVIAKFYEPFHNHLVEKEKSLKKDDIMPEVTTEEICDKCGSPMVIKTGRYGKFLACSNFPDCKNTKPINNGQTPAQAVEQSEEIKALNEKHKDEVCDKCGSPMAVKTGRFGPFLACTAYPKCKNIKNLNGQENKQAVSTGIKCPACGDGEIVAKKSRYGIFYACSNYPKCKNAYQGKPTGDKCSTCGALMIESKKGIVCGDKACPTNAK